VVILFWTKDQVHNVPSRHWWSPWKRRRQTIYYRSKNQQSSWICSIIISGV